MHFPIAVPLCALCPKPSLPYPQLPDLELRSTFFCPQPPFLPSSFYRQALPSSLGCLYFFPPPSRFCPCKAGSSPGKWDSVPDSLSPHWGITTGLSDGTHSSGEEPWLERDMAHCAPVLPAPVHTSTHPGKFT